MGIHKYEYLEKLEAISLEHLQIVIGFLQLPETVVCHQPDVKSWNVLQCMEHLNTYGDYYIPAIKNALSGAEKLEKDQLLTQTFLGRYFIKMMDPDKGKRKYKAFKKHRPKFKLNKEVVLNKNMGQMEALVGLLRECKHLNINNIAIPISLTKYIKIPLHEVFGFLVAHNERHIQQAKRTIKWTGEESFSGK